MSQTMQERNKALVLEAFDTLFNKRDYEAAERFWSPNYIQHRRGYAPGRGGLFEPPTRACYSRSVRQVARNNSLWFFPLCLAFVAVLVLVRSRVWESANLRQAAWRTAGRMHGAPLAHSGRPSAPRDAASEGCKVAFWRTCAQLS